MDTPKQYSVLDELNDVQNTTFSLLNTLESRLNPVSHRGPQDSVITAKEGIDRNHITTVLTRGYTVNAQLQTLIDELAV